jgi:dipeptidyl aminopeptidase/acylaminoacyl peptidase
MSRAKILAGMIVAGFVTLSALPRAQDAPRAAAAARVPRFELTVESIMRGPKLVGYEPAGLRWAGDSSLLYFEWRKAGEDEASTYVVGRDGTGLRKLSDEERKVAPPAFGGQWDRARRRVLFADRGDIVIVDTVEKTRRQLTRTSAPEGSPRWVRDENAVTFVRDGSLFLMPLTGGGLEQVTDVQPRKREAREGDSQKFLKAEEQKLIEHTREAAAKKKKAEDEAARDRIPTFEVQEGQVVTDAALSPDGKHVFLMVNERPTGARNADTPNYLTESAYTEMIPGRTNVGDLQGRRRLAVVDLASGKSTWVDSSFAGKTQVVQPSAQGGDKKEVERDVFWGMPLLSADGRLAVSWAMAADFKDRWIVAIDAGTGKCRVLDSLHDEAWVHDGFAFGFGRGPGSGFLPDNRRIFFTAEKDGWMHLYTLDASQPGAQAVALTKGKFEVSAVALSKDGTRFYFASSEVHPGERHLYSMPVDGGAATKLTAMTGSNLGEVSPDDKTLGFVHSCSNRPPEVYVAAAQGPGEARQVTTSTSDEWRSFKWAEPQVLTIKARDGAEIHARLYTPEMLGARRRATRPAVLFVHGAGYLQNAHKYWSSYFREYMFNNLLASRGYVVLDMDYRASAGYGRDWRTAIYRHMGGKDLDDIVDGAKYLVAAQKVDPRRIGLYGGSYGGFITLMAMFTALGTFSAGAALRPVTDWSHYSHGYTGQILNLPQDDPEAYRKSSPIYFAEGLKGALLICHGIVDTNVHFQDSMRLVQRLIELRKDNWELAPYPVENHGFEDEASWVDEYKRILRLFEKNLKN